MREGAAGSRRSLVEAAIRRDRAVIVGGLVVLTGLAWAHLLSMGSMTVAPDGRAWPAGQVLVLFVMWAVMMVAMMLPSAVPLLLLFARVRRRRRQARRAAVPTAVFLTGYLVVWTGYSAVAALAQWLLHEAALLSPMMRSASPVLAGVLLVGAGVYQWTPLKNACLTRCRSPLGFVNAEWREGTTGALLMGIRHGNYCVGCCWILMALLFVAGVMNLLWVAALAGLVLLEKVAPGGDRLGRAAGVVMVVWGGWLLAGGVL